MHRVVAAGIAPRRDPRTVGLRKASPRGGEARGVGCAQAASAPRCVLHGGPQVVDRGVAGDALQLRNVVDLVREGVERAEVDPTNILGVPRGVGRIGRPAGRGIDQVAPGLPVVVIAGRIAAVDLARKGVLAAAAQDEVDRRAAHVVVRRRAVQHLGFLDALDGRGAEQRRQLLRRHGRGLAVEDDPHCAHAGQFELPVPLADARQAREGLIGVVHRPALGERFQVVRETARLDFDQRPFGCDLHGAEHVVVLLQDDLAHLVAVVVEGVWSVGEMLEEEAVGPYGRSDAKTAQRVGGHAPEVERIGAEQHHGHARDGATRRIDDGAADRLCRGDDDGQQGEQGERDGSYHEADIFIRMAKIAMKSDFPIRFSACGAEFGVSCRGGAVEKEGAACGDPDRAARPEVVPARGGSDTSSTSKPRPLRVGVSPCECCAIEGEKSSCSYSCRKDSEIPPPTNFGPLKVLNTTIQAFSEYSFSGHSTNSGCRTRRSRPRAFYPCREPAECIRCREPSLKKAPAEQTAGAS